LKCEKRTNGLNGINKPSCQFSLAHKLKKAKNVLNGTEKSKKID